MAGHAAMTGAENRNIILGYQDTQSVMTFGAAQDGQHLLQSMQIRACMCTRQLKVGAGRGRAGQCRAVQGRAVGRGLAEHNAGIKHAV